MCGDTNGAPEVIARKTKTLLIVHVVSKELRLFTDEGRRTYPERIRVTFSFRTRSS
jgi:hypothetical protein